MSAPPGYDEKYQGGYQPSGGQGGYANPAGPVVSPGQVVIQQPSTVVHTTITTGLAQRQTRPWSSGICGCFEDCMSCVCVWLCPTCYLCCVISDRMGEDCCTPIALRCSFLTDTAIIMAYRYRLRTKYNIPGSLSSDCCCASWCGPCALCQIVRELNAIERETGQPAFEKGI